MNGQSKMPPTTAFFTVQVVSGVLISSEEPVVKMSVRKGVVSYRLELPFFSQDTHNDLENRMKRGIRDFLLSSTYDFVVIDKLNKYRLDGFKNLVVDQWKSACLLPQQVLG